ncbi:MAG: arylamine N-acetyltransferase [Blastocatellia bacterium]|nr:arylamine N-acetyltransferase [Blastocatellia bacterium]
MNQQNETGRLSDDLRERILARLGFSAAPAADLDGLRALYEAWCMRVPFDNVRKMIALRGGGSEPLPGGEAADFFAAWLRDGVGGTCWPTSNGLFALLDALGFEARRIAGAMRDLGIVNHGSVKVKLDGRD